MIVEGFAEVLRDVDNEHQGRQVRVEREGQQPLRVRHFFRKAEPRGEISTKAVRFNQNVFSVLLVVYHSQKKRLLFVCAISLFAGILVACPSRRQVWALPSLLFKHGRCGDGQAGCVS